MYLTEDVYVCGDSPEIKKKTIVERNSSISLPQEPRARDDRGGAAEGVQGGRVDRPDVVRRAAEGLLPEGVEDGQGRLRGQDGRVT